MKTRNTVNRQDLLHITISASQEEVQVIHGSDGKIQSRSLHLPDVLSAEPFLLQTLPAVHLPCLAMETAWPCCLASSCLQPPASCLPIPQGVSSALMVLYATEKLLGGAQGLLYNAELCQLHP